MQMLRVGGRLMPPPPEGALIEVLATVERPWSVTLLDNGTYLARAGDKAKTFNDYHAALRWIIQEFGL